MDQAWSTSASASAPPEAATKSNARQRSLRHAEQLELEVALVRLVRDVERALALAQLGFQPQLLDLARERVAAPAQPRGRFHPVAAGMRQRSADERLLEFLLQPVAEDAVGNHELVHEDPVEHEEASRLRRGHRRHRRDGQRRLHGRGGQRPDGCREPHRIRVRRLPDRLRLCQRPDRWRRATAGPCCAALGRRWRSRPVSRS